MSMKPSIAALGLGVVALSASPTSLAAPIPEYRALYRNVDEGAPGSADVSLTYDSVAGRYTLIVTRVDAVERESEKTLRFNLVDDKIRPLTYREEYGRCGSCTVAVTFDWDGRRYGHDSGGYQYVGLLTERDGSPSRVVRDVAMLVANLPGRRELAGGFDDVLTEKSLGTVELTTPLGSVRADGRALRWRDAAIWFARELDDLPVRIVAFGVGLELAELQGIELMVTRGATAFEDGVIATSPASGAPGIRFPEYRAAYRVDENRRVGAGRLETAVSYDLASDSYELVATATETKHPEDAQVIRLPFRVVADRVQPLGLHVDEGGRRARTVDIDWTLDEVIMRSDGPPRRYPFIAFENRDEPEVESAMLEQLAQLLAILPGHPEIAGFDDVLSSESLGAAEISLPMGSFSVERLVLRGRDMSLEVWQARELGDLPVRFFGPVMARKATTIELTELNGIERASAPAR